MTLPPTISSPSQLNPNALAGSSIEYIKFLGMTSNYMESHRSEFSSFGADMSKMKFESSDGKKYKVDSTGLVILDAKVYIISVAISNNVSTNVLRGMYNDSTRFIDMVRRSYNDNPELIVGITRLNDNGTSGSDGLGTKDNLNSAFSRALAAGADFVIFHFSDHGNSKTSSGDGYLALYGSKYTYQELFDQFRKFKNVFAILCCCYPNSTDSPFTPGANGTRALFWNAS